MSDIMLHGVLNMPPELWNNDSPIDVMQRHSRYVQASKYIDELERELTAAREELNAVTEQRDRLAEALKKAKLVYTPSSGGEYQTGWHDAISWINQQALQSLKEH